MSVIILRLRVFFVSDFMVFFLSLYQVPRRKRMIGSIKEEVKWLQQVWKWSKTRKNITRGKKRNEIISRVLTSLVGAELSLPLLGLIFVICIETVVDAVIALPAPVPVVSPPLLGVQHNRLYVHCKASASRPPKLDKQISINGTPTKAYKMVAIFPLDVFGVKFPWPVEKTQEKWHLHYYVLSFTSYFITIHFIRLTIIKSNALGEKVQVFTKHSSTTN